MRIAFILSVVTVSVALTGCQVHQVNEPTPAVIGPDEVYVRNFAEDDGRNQAFVQQCNGKTTVRSEWTHMYRNLYPIRLPAGRSRIEICVIYLTFDHGGLLEDWEVDLPGGREYVLEAVLGENLAEVWFEDVATGQPVTERRQIAIVFDYDLKVTR